MNRTDRLHALTEELRRAGDRGRSSDQLAGWLEVSTRTIKRDVTALQEAGLPIWAQAGPGGGYVLAGGGALPPITLTARQVVAVGAALAAQTGAPYAADGRVALEKMLDVLGPEARETVRQLGARVWVRHDDPPARAAGAVEDALARRRVVAVTYRDRFGRVTRRRVEPHLVARTGGHWYLVAWCLERDALRWFRLDRVDGADVTTCPVTDRDLATFGTPPPDAHSVRGGADSAVPAPTANAGAVPPGQRPR